MTVIHADLTPLEWESQFFSQRTSRLLLREEGPILSLERLAEWQRVQAKIPAGRNDLLAGLLQLGFQFVEGEVDTVLSTEQCGPVPQYTAAGLDAIVPLRQITVDLFTHSRFRLPWYQPDDAGRFYAQWAENAVRGTFDDLCLLCDPQDVSRGFVTLRQLNRDEARIGLLAGYGMGRTLLAIARDWCQVRGIRRLHVATQLSNASALRLYFQSGGVLSHSAFWLYR